MPQPVNLLNAGPNPIPPKLPAARPGHPLALAIGLAAPLAVGALLFFFNPAEHALYPQCFFHQATGWHCPGCGGLRAAHQLLHGHPLIALRLNAPAVISLPLFAALLWRELASRRQGITGRPFVSEREMWCFLAVLAVFTVLRNFPAFAFLAP